MQDIDMFKILFDISIDVSKCLTKTGKTYLRVRHDKFHPKQIIEGFGSRYQKTTGGYLSMLTFVNKDSVAITTWDWSVYKAMSKKDFDNPVKKAIAKKWKSLPWKTKYLPGKQKLIFKLKKNGEPCVLFLNRYTSRSRRRRTHKNYRYIPLNGASHIVHNMISGLSGRERSIFSIGDFNAESDAYKKLSEMVVQFALGNLKR
jgi:hypothetical protein